VVPLIVRIFMVITAIMLVAAIAVGTLSPTDLPLGQGLDLMDQGLPDEVHRSLARNAPWLWSWLVQPFLLRPVWLIPACIGILTGGIAVTLGMRARPGAGRSRPRGRL
jgi:hypothetical protein